VTCITFASSFGYTQIHAQSPSHNEAVLLCQEELKSNEYPITSHC
jgi:hypothetical protein